MKKNKCKNLYIEKNIVLKEALYVVGSYVLTWGLIGTANFNIVLKQPIFWGLVLILTGSVLQKKVK